MGTVVRFTGITTLPVPIQRIVDDIPVDELDRIIVIGVRKDGPMFYAFSESDGGCLVWDMERCKHDLMKTADKLESGEP